MQIVLRPLLFGVVFWLISPTSVDAYSQATHRLLSGLALRQSDAGGSSSLYQLLPIQFTDAFNSISDGADEEDNDNRGVNHFFDPITGLGLHFAFGAVQFTASPDWIIDGVKHEGEKIDYLDLFQSYYDGLTKPTEQARALASNKMFNTLGHVVHHIQDMAQPQHTRNDDHCDATGFSAASALCSNLTGLYKPSAYEAFTAQRSRDFLAAPFFPFSPKYSKAKPDANFVTVDDFWENGKRGDSGGMATYSNRNFVTSGTNFFACSANPRGYCAASGYPDPNPESTSKELGVIDSLVGQQTYIKFTPEGGGQAEPISTTTIFLEALTGEYVMNNITYRVSNKYLIPRALAYSAGIINFFFRADIDARADLSTGEIFVRNLGDKALTGVFQLFYDSKDDGMRHPATSAFTATAAAHGGEAATGVHVPVVNSKVDSQFVLVFKGQAADASDETVVSGKIVHLTAPVTGITLFVPTVLTGWFGLPATITLDGFYPTTQLQFESFGTSGNSCGGEIGFPSFSAIVDHDAQFFGAPTVIGVPQLGGGPPINRRPCSSFFARKIDVNGNGKIWINATGHGQSFSGFGSLDWEYQVRYYSGDPAVNYSDATCAVGVVPGSGFFNPNPVQCNVKCDVSKLGKLPANSPSCN